MKRLTEQEFQEKVTNNEMIKLAVNELEDMFKNNFFLTEKEMKDIIIDIVSRTDEDLILGLTDIFQKFVNFKVEDELSQYDKRKLAKSVISNCIDLYNIEKQEIVNEFFGMLDEAIKFKINPYKLAIKTNLRKASKDKFYLSLYSLVEKEYVDIYTNEHFKLFKQSEIKALFEDCASLASGLNEKDVQNVLDILSKFAYDEENNVYFVRPETFIHKVKSILKNPNTLQKNIDYLIGTFVPEFMTRKELVLRVAESPTILLCKPEKVIDFEDKLTKCVLKILNSETFSEKVENKKEFALKYARDFCYNLDHFNMINAVNENSFSYMEKITEVLIENLGANNAIKCLHKAEILSCSPDVLDCFLTKLASQEKEYNFDFRAFFIENTALCLNLMQGEDETISPEDLIKHTRAKSEREKVEADRTVIPKIKDGAFEDKYSSLSSIKRKEVDKLSNNLLEKLEERKEKSKKTRETRKFLKIQEEFQKISQIKNELGQKNYSSDYVMLLERIKTFLDDKYGEGYSDEKYYINSYINRFNDLVTLNQKYLDYTKRTDDLSESLKTLGIVSAQHNGIQNPEVLNKEMVDFDSKIKVLLNKLEEIQKNLIEANREGIKIISRISQVDERLNLNTEKKFRENFEPSFVIDEILNNGIFMRYLEMMKKVIDKEFKDKAETILPTYEIESILDQKAITEEKLRLYGAVCALSKTLCKFLEENSDIALEMIKSENEKHKSIVEPQSSGFGVNIEINQFTETNFVLENRNLLRNIAIVAKSWWERRLKLQKETSINNRFNSILKGIELKIDENGSLIFEAKMPKLDEMPFAESENGDNYLTNKKCLAVCSLVTDLPHRKRKKDGKDEK